MKYLKTFESFSPINEEEGFFGAAKKFLVGDPIEENLIKGMHANGLIKYLNDSRDLSKEDENKVIKGREQIESEKDMTKKNEILKELIGDWEDGNTSDRFSRMGVKCNLLRDKLGCMTPEEKEAYDSRPGGSTGWEGSRGFH